MSSHYWVDGQQLPVREWNPNGKRTPIVLVHGFIVSSRYFSKLGAALAALGHPVYAPNFPGHGTFARSPHFLNTQELGHCLAEFIVSLKADKVIVMAHSYGCSIATEAQICLEDDVIEHLIYLGPATGEGRLHSLQMTTRFIGTIWREPPWAIAAAALDALQLGVRRSLQEGREMFKYDIKKRLPLVTAQTYFARGEHDKVASAELLIDLSERVRDARVATFAGTAHEPHASEPERVAKFISTLSARSRGR